MDENNAVATATTNGTKSSDASMWDYEAPQFCDFSSADTFQDNDPNVDKYFLTDHENTKENVDDDFGDSDSDVFTTPMSVRGGEMRLSNTSTVSSMGDYGTPKSSVGKSLSFATPTNTNRLSTLRQTPLRDIYNSGGAPLHESGHGTKVFKSGRKSRKPETPKPKSIATSLLKKKHQESLKATTAAANGTPNSRRETYDMAAINEAIDEIVATKEVECKNQEVDQHVENDAALYSEDDDDDEEHEHEQTILVQNSGEESKLLTSGNDSLLSETGDEAVAQQEAEAVQFHAITEQELEQPVVTLNADAAQDLATSTPDNNLSPNASRRSSYIVKSPNIRMVHFDEQSIVANQKLDVIEEDNSVAVPAVAGCQLSMEEQITPVLSESSKKIKARQLTPMVAKPGESGEKPAKKSSLLSGIRQRLSKKYIKRFSKSMTPCQEDEEEKSADVVAVEGVAGPSKPTNTVTKSVTASKHIGMTKKRVTIAEPSSQKPSTSSSVANNTTVVKAKRTMSLKGTTNRNKSTSFRSAASVLARSKSFGAVKDSVPLVPATTKSPYLGLTVLNHRFMSNSLRHYSPLVSTGVKPRSTVAKSPNLLTSQRCSIRKFHTLPVLNVSPPKKVVKPAPSMATGSKGTKPAPFVPTKAITPKFCTESRLKQWHAKHDHDDGSSGSGHDQADGSGVHTFKARPAPNFKRIQANEEKRKKEALEKAKNALKQHKMEPFSFESRAVHGPNKGGHGKA